MKAEPSKLARIRLSTDTLSKAIATKTQADQIDVLAAAVDTMADNLNNAAIIQVPELTSVLAELRDTVSMLLAHQETMERLGVEMLADQRSR